MQTAAALIEREEERGTERMDELLERGKANGDTLTCSELVEALEQQMMTPDAMDMLYQRLIDGNVEIVDDTEAGEMIGEEPAAALRETSLALYARAAAIARDRGIILADTKFEFGAGPDGELVLGDEVLTPDSSRFWPADQWMPGRVTPSFDKQYVRDWLTSPASGWDRSSGQEPPALPADVVERTRARYLEAYERLTGTLLAV